MIDNGPMTITALDGKDERRFDANVAGPAALLVAKLHKLDERIKEQDRLNDKDAHDIYRVLVDTPTSDLSASMVRLLLEPVSEEVTDFAMRSLAKHFATATSQGSIMAGRAEEGVGEPETVAASVRFSQKISRLL